MEMMDLMLSVEPAVAQFLERMTEGSMEAADSAEDFEIEVYFAMAGAQAGNGARRVGR